MNSCRKFWYSKAETTHELILRGLVPRIFSYLQVTVIVRLVYHFPMFSTRLLFYTNKRKLCREGKPRTLFLNRSSMVWDTPIW